MNSGPAPLLACRGVSKRFGAVLANQDVDLEAFAGEVLAVLGENGAGKSTLMSILAGRYRPDAGEVLLDGKPVRPGSPAEALRRGIGMVYQRFALVEPLTAAENVLLAARARGRADLAGVRRRMAELAGRYGLAVDPDRPVADLSMGERQRVEIVKLLVQEARALIFDEPTAVLAQPEVEGFFRVLKRLTADGRAVLFITHKLEEVLAAADRIAILRRGRVMARLLPSEVGSRRDLARLMVGREFVLRVDKPTLTPGRTVLAAENLSGPGFADVSLTVRQGEIVSVVGVAGNGQAELAATLAGLARAGSGRISFLGEDYTPARWAARRGPGLAYVPEDRNGAGCVRDMDLAENLALTRLPEFSRGPWLDRGRMRRAAQEAIRGFAIQPPDARARAGGLSGGNLQKLILARELGREPALFLAESPTQGLDAAASQDVWQALGGGQIGRAHV